jgi:hypothetical protein
MASIDVDTAALHAAAGSIGGIADSFTAKAVPTVAVSSAQATSAAVTAVHAAAIAAESTMAARLRSTATGLAAGGSFEVTERASTAAISALAPGER